jgi:hypothetical protein
MQAVGKAKPSFLSQHLEGSNREGNDYPYELEDLKGAAGVMYVGGAEAVCYTEIPWLILYANPKLLDIRYNIQLLLCHDTISRHTKESSAGD